MSPMRRARAGRWPCPETVREVSGYVTLLGTSGYIFALCVRGCRHRRAGGRARHGAAFQGGHERACRACDLRLRGQCGRRDSVAAPQTSRRPCPAEAHEHRRTVPFRSVLDQGEPRQFSLRPHRHRVCDRHGLSYFAPRLRLPLFLVASLVAVSRLMVGAHYPSDVLAGIVFGVGTAIYARRAFATRGLVFRRVGDRIRVRRAGSLSAALGALADRVRR